MPIPVVDYFSTLHQSLGVGTPETSGYPALANLLNAVGETLKPKIAAVIHPANNGAGIPDGGMFSAKDIKKHGGDRESLFGRLKPERGEHYNFAPSENEFWTKAHTLRSDPKHPEHDRLWQFLRRALLSTAKINTPQDLAAFLASSAREARARVEIAPMGTLEPVKKALSESLGIHFEGEKGSHFFQSTLIQTLFYGIFSAWVLWHESHPKTGDRFQWKSAVDHLGLPILRSLFHQVAYPANIRRLNLEEVLDHEQDERAGVFLTNALTGWVPVKHPKDEVLFSEFADERDHADQVKQKEQILVIIGNPPYDGYAGMAVEEERSLSEAYRTTKQAPAPQGQGLNNLYIRFFRMAERRIAEGVPQTDEPKPGPPRPDAKGIVCFISNYSWLDGLSHPGMRERFMEVFDSIKIDCLNGDKYKTGKKTPDGKPDPSVFSTEKSAVGIQVGTAIALLECHPARDAPPRAPISNSATGGEKTNARKSRHHLMNRSLGLI